MRLAVFCPYLPAPAVTGGRIRITRLLTEVAKEHELHLFAKANRKEAAQGADSPELGYFQTRCVKPARLELARLASESERVVSGTPSRLFAAYKQAHQQKPFDGALIEHSHAGGFATTLGVPFVLDEHNVESHYLAAKHQAKRDQSRLGALQVRRLAAHEERLWRAAHAVASVSAEEAQEIERRSGRPASVIANGVRLSALPYVAESAREPATLLFVGLMDHAPNVAAAIELATVILPEVQAEVPEARLILCGRNPAPEVRQLQSKSVEVTGSVDSVGPYWSRATVFANALRGGAGTSLKLIEALAAGIPIVSTAQGARGFRGLVPNEHYCWCESPQDFAKQLVLILRTPKAFEQQTRAGRRFAEQYDWPELGRRYLQLITRALST